MRTDFEVRREGRDQSGVEQLLRSRESSEAGGGRMRSGAAPRSRIGRGANHFRDDGPAHGTGAADREIQTRRSLRGFSIGIRGERGYGGGDPRSGRSHYFG